MDRHTLGYLILKHRKEKHLTQQELADKLYVSATTISKWERGNSRPDLEKLKVLSSVLEIPLALLLGIDTAEINESAEKTAAAEKASAEKTAATEMASTENAAVTEKTSGEQARIAVSPETAVIEIPPDKKLGKKKLPRKMTLMIAGFSIAVFVLMIFTTAVVLHPRDTASAENTDFSKFEILLNYHGSYNDLDSCYIIVKCDKENSEEAYIAYAEEFIRKNYSSCFEEVETIVIFYLSDYSEEADFEDISHYIVVLYSLPDFEDLYSDTL